MAGLAGLAGWAGLAGLGLTGWAGLAGLCWLAVWRSGWISLRGSGVMGALQPESNLRGKLLPL